jgi:hypothetical protein
MSSSSASFASRGNPMVTEREAIRDFGRNPDTENAEYDADRQRYRRKVDRDFDAAVSGVDSADMSQFTRAGFNRQNGKGSLFRQRNWHDKSEVVVEIRKKRKIAGFGAFDKHLEKLSDDRLRSAANSAQIIRNTSIIPSSRISRKILRISEGERDNIPATVPAGSNAMSREKQTPPDLARHGGFYDFTGKKGSPNKKEIKKAGKIFRRKTYKTEL